MRSLLSVKITDKGEHWHKEIRIFGILVYHRHDYTREIKQRPMGFTAYPYNPIDVDDEEDYEE